MLCKGYVKEDNYVCVSLVCIATVLFYSYTLK